MGIGANLIGAVAGRNPGQLEATLHSLATVIGWTPFGWAWAVPADVARGDWLVAGLHLLLAVALVATLWLAWAHFLGARLVSPLDAAGESAKVRDSNWVERLYPASPAGGVAARTLRYWRRDPRYLAGIAGFLIAPVVLIVTQVATPGGSPEVAVFAPSLVGLFLGLSVAQDLSYDGTALWLHVSAGLRGADDRRGRVLSTVTVYLPMLVVLFAVAVVASGAWSLLVPAIGLTLGLTLAGLGVGSVVGALWQWPAPPPGSNPFQKGSQGGLPALLCVMVTSFGTMLVALPTVVVVVWSIFTPWVGYLSVPVALATGLVAVKVGIAQGGRLLDRRWPEVMLAVSEKTG